MQGPWGELCKNVLFHSNSPLWIASLMILNQVNTKTKKKEQFDLFYFLHNYCLCSICLFRIKMMPVEFSFSPNDWFFDWSTTLLHKWVYDFFFHSSSWLFIFARPQYPC